MTFSTSTSTTAERLRSDFDDSFARQRQAVAATTEEFLAIRIGDDPYALRITAVTGLFSDRKITPLPGPISDLLGLAGFRSSLAPIYDLRSLMGRPGHDQPRWLVLTAVPAGVLGLAFDHFEGYFRLGREHLSEPPAGNARRHVVQVAQTAAGARPIIHLPSLIDIITERAGTRQPRLARSTES